MYKSLDVLKQASARMQHAKRTNCMGNKQNTIYKQSWKVRPKSSLLSTDTQKTSPRTNNTQIDTPGTPENLRKPRRVSQLCTSSSEKELFRPASRVPV